MVPPFNSLIQGKLLNSGRRDLASKKLETLYHVVHKIFRHTEQDMDHQCDRQMDGQMELWQQGS